MNRQLFAAGLLATLLSAGCATTPTAERYVAPPQGSTWVYKRIDTGSYGSGTVQSASKMGERIWQGQKLNAYESPEMTLLAKPTGDWVAQVSGNMPLISWDPPVTWNWPLEVGKTGTRSFRVTFHAVKQSMSVEDRWTVEAYEDVTVPAGTFKTFRVKTTDSIGNDNVNWFSPDLGIFVKSSLKRTAKHPAGAGTREIELVSQTIRR